jgi:hypothetical protein
MLVFEDEDEDHLHFGRALPRDWVASGKPVAILGAPTRWGRVDYHLETRDANNLAAVINLPAKGPLPKELHVTFRIPVGRNLNSATVNGRPATFTGTHKDAVVITTGPDRHFEVITQLS